MTKPLYYFTIDLVIEEHKLTCPYEIANQVLNDFGEEFTVSEIVNYLKNPIKKYKGVTMKEIFES